MLTADGHPIEPQGPLLKFPEKLNGFFEPGMRHYVLHGGRGSAKSWSVAAFLVTTALTAPHRILCGREYQNSIRESVKYLIDAQIRRLGYVDEFESKRTYIKSRNGSEFIFAGLHHNIESLKSMEGITIAWLEEAQTISRNSMTDFVPTIRAPGSFLIYTMNPRFATDPVYEDLVEPKVPRDDVRTLELNYADNPWFWGSPLVGEMRHMRKTNPGMYRHVWRGGLLQDDAARIFPNVAVEAFETPDDADFMYGADFGFANDPAVILRTFMSPDESKIFVDYEIQRYHLKLNKYAETYDLIPGIRNGVIVGDSSQPQTIDHLVDQGFRAIGAIKGAGSVMEGIRFLQSKDIIVHPRCESIVAESYLYVFKRHPQTNHIMPIPVDKNNHAWDALRYAWEGKWMKSSPMFAFIG